MAFAGETDCEVDRDGGLADTAFARADGDDVLDTRHARGGVVLRNLLGGSLIFGCSLCVALQFEDDLAGVVNKIDDETKVVYAVVLCTGADELFDELAHVGEGVAVGLGLVWVALCVADAHGGIRVADSDVEDAAAADEIAAVWMGDAGEGVVDEFFGEGHGGYLSEGWRLGFA